jgi:structural maintenance of chromosomes protein 6
MGATREEIAAELLKASKDVKAAERRYQGTERVEKVRYYFIGDFPHYLC